MAQANGRILLLLASTDFSINELRAFALGIERFGAEHAIDDIRSLRDFASHGSIGKGAPAVVYNRTRTDSGSDTASVLSSNTVSVLNGMRLASRLSAQDWAQHFFEELRTLLGPNVQIPERGKAPLGQWFKKLARVIPNSDLMHVATKLQKKFDSNIAPDWALIRDKNE